jgi:hypothetical protein
VIAMKKRLPFLLLGFVLVTATAFGGTMILDTGGGLTSVPTLADVTAIGATTSVPTTFGDNLTGAKILQTGTETANTLWAGPASGAAAAPGFRAAVAADIPGTPNAAGGNATLTAPREYYFCTGACVVTLPVPVANASYEFCIMNDDNVATVIKVAVPGTVYLENTARTSYATIGYRLASAGAAADKLCVVSRDATHYIVPSYSGTWTAIQW